MLRVYLASLSVNEIKWGMASGLIDGVVATPAVFADELPHADPREILKEITAATPLPVFASPGAVEEAEIVKRGKELIKISEHTILAIPFVEDALPAIRRLTSDGIRCAATLVHSVAQGLLAAKAGASMVVVPVDALEAVGDSSSSMISDLRMSLDRLNAECDIVAAGPASAARMADVIAEGADSIVVTPQTLRSFIQHPLTDRGMDRFLQDISRRAKPRRAR